MIIFFLIGLLALILASIQDLKKGIIENWLTFGLAGIALSVRLFISPELFLEGLASFGIFLIFGLAIFFIGNFGGGDAKLFAALGAVIILKESLYFLFILAAVLGIYVIVSKLVKHDLPEIRIAPGFLIAYILFFGLRSFFPILH